MNLATYLNKSRGDYAYIDEGMRLVAICNRGDFPKAKRRVAVVELPWRGTQEELEDEIEAQLVEQEHFLD